jgi:hypothetical protein
MKDGHFYTVGTEDSIDKYDGWVKEIFVSTRLSGADNLGEDCNSLY